MHQTTSSLIIFLHILDLLAAHACHEPETAKRPAARASCSLFHATHDGGRHGPPMSSSQWCGTAPAEGMLVFPRHAGVAGHSRRRISRCCAAMHLGLSPGDMVVCMGYREPCCLPQRPPWVQRGLSFVNRATRRVYHKEAIGLCGFGTADWHYLQSIHLQINHYFVNYSGGLTST